MFELKIPQKCNFTLTMISMHSVLVQKYQIQIRPDSGYRGYFTVECPDEYLWK